MDNLSQVVLLLGVGVTIVVTFLRWQIPSSLGYLLVGVILGPHTIGPVIQVPQIEALAEFGIVFLLFTIGLSFSLPQIHALRHYVLPLGTGQVVLTTAILALGGWLAGIPPAAAFVIGAVFAQSSSTIIGKQLQEQGEGDSSHGRLALAMSVFQDVTAVPFVVVIPVLGVQAAALDVAGSLALSMAKGTLAFALVFMAGRWLLRPVFHWVAESRSTEVFTLTVLLVALLAAWATSSLGLSLAFGGFLIGMMLGETEFRHQVESSIRPFRDVLLGLFFVGIGMLLDPSALSGLWHWALLGAVILIAGKTVLVTLLMSLSGFDRLSAWRTGLLLALGGEFGFALLAIALNAAVIEVQLGQIALTSVLFSMIAGPLIIRYNLSLASALAGRYGSRQEESAVPVPVAGTAANLHDHVIICGYGRIGQSVGNFLQEERIPFIALDLDPARVRKAHAAGEPVFFGDGSERGILEVLNLQQAALVVISHGDIPATLKALAYLKLERPELPVLVRTRDENEIERLRDAGALEVVPETLEAGLTIASEALLLLGTPPLKVMRRIKQQRAGRYHLMREYFKSDAERHEAGDGE